MSNSMNFNFQQKQSLKQTQRLIMSPQMQQAINLLQMPIMELSSAIQTEMDQNPLLEYSDPLSSDPKDEFSESIEAPDSQTPENSELQFDEQCFDVLLKLDEDFKDHFSQTTTPKSSTTQEDQKKQTFLENSIQKDESLYEILLSQANESFDSIEDAKMAKALIGNFDHRGFLSSPLEEIALLNEFKLEQLQNILLEIQTFEPLGVGASTIQESLLIQLTCLKKKKTLAYDIVHNHYEDILKNKLPNIQKSTGASIEEIRYAIDHDIAHLDLKPGMTSSNNTVHYIVPDIIVTYEDKKFSIKIHEESLPPIRLNEEYLKMLKNKQFKEKAKEYVEQKVTSGKWLIRNLMQRNNTLYRITESLIQKQNPFFIEVEGKLKPLTMKTISEELDLHESTIARAISNKYIDTPRGLFLLKSFFTNAYATKEGSDISSSTVKELLVDIIKKENKHRPLSDEIISKKIKEQGVSCARRTIAKYRNELNIGNTTQRKSFY